MLDKFLAMLQKPFEIVEPGVVAVNKNYEIDADLMPIHYKPPIHHHVIDQDIIDMQDFIDFVNEYATEATKLFVSEDSVTAVFNYSTPGKADYGDSKAVMPLFKTTEFVRFTNAMERKLSQTEFIRVLKQLEPYITALDGKEATDMDVVEMAEELQAIRKVDSIVRNTANKFTIDAEVRTGKTGMTIPRTITFTIAPFKNDPDIKMPYTVELFLTANDGTFTAEMICYAAQETTELALKQITKTVSEQINAKSFRV